MYSHCFHTALLHRARFRQRAPRATTRRPVPRALDMPGRAVTRRIVIDASSRASVVCATRARTRTRVDACFRASTARDRPRARGDAARRRRVVTDVASTERDDDDDDDEDGDDGDATRRGARRARAFVVAASSSSVNRENRAVGELALGRETRAGALAPPRRYERAVAVVRPESHPTATTEFMTPSFAVYAMCGVGCLLGSALSAALLSLIPASAPPLMDEVAYLAASVREEVPDTLAAVRVSGLELTDVMEEVGELTADVGGGLRSAGRGVTAAERGQTAGRFAAAAIPEVRRRAKPLVGSVRIRRCGCWRSGRRWNRTVDPSSRTRPTRPRKG